MGFYCRRFTDSEILRCLLKIIRYRFVKGSSRLVWLRLPWRYNKEVLASGLCPGDGARRNILGDPMIDEFTGVLSFLSAFSVLLLLP